jgi:ABC-type multidrug transport system fused ATPase/permease subunit
LVQILVDGVPLTELDAGWFRSQMGVVMQEPSLFAADIFYNIAYGIPDGRPVSAQHAPDVGSKSRAL